MEVFINFKDLFLSVWDQGILGIDIGQILIGLGIFLIFLIFRGLISKLILKKLEIISKKTTNKLDDTFVKSLVGPARFLPIVLGFFFASYYMTFSDETSSFVDTVNRTLITILLFWIIHQIIEPISLLLVSASLEKGEKLFKKCSACHNYEKDSANKVGPNLWNLINRPKANVEGFAYSKALAEYGGDWGYEELAEFLYKPKKYIKGTKMNFAGLKKVEDRANLVLFLREHSDSPVPLP